jgi:hypothetical protein
LYIKNLKKMDNIENTSPSGEADVTASQGQLDATDTQPVEDSSSVDGGTEKEAGQASNPWDNDPKFKGKAPEDIYKAYREIEKSNGQLSQKAQIANLIEEKYGVTPEQLKAQIEQQEYQRKQALYANNPLAPVLDKVQFLEQKVQQQERDKALIEVKGELDGFLKDNPAYEAHKDKLLKLVLTPGIGFDPETEEETPVADLAREYFGEARAQGQQDAYKKIETKQMTQATSVSRGATKSKLTLDEMRGMSASELASILPHSPVN